MTAATRWWKRRSRLQKTVLLAVAGVVVIVAAVAPSTRSTLDPTTSSTLAFVATAPASTPGTAAPSSLTSAGAPATATVTTSPRPSATLAAGATTAPLGDTLPATGTTTATGTTLATGTVPVLRVVDGDTIVVRVSGTEQEVRLIGIDTPESGEAYADEARAALAGLVGGAAVRLETDVDSRDQYGRLLAYVWYGNGPGKMANAEMLRRGLATVFTVPPNVMYVEMLQRCQDEAQAAHAGVWGAPGDSPLQIVAVEYDAPGDDSQNLNAEYISFKVLVSGTLLGYSIEDESGKRYRFPDRVFKKGDLFKLHSGSGTDTQTDLYWGVSGSAIWNNNGDTVKVLDPDDKIVASYSY